MAGALTVAAAAIVIADGCLLLVCWRRRSALGGLCALLVGVALAAGLSTGIGEGALIISIVVLVIGIALLGLGQTVQRLLDHEPEERV